MFTAQPEPQPNQNQHQPTRLPVRTHHCRFCNHLLLATTHNIPSLPRRKDPAKDQAIILPFPPPRDNESDDDESNLRSRKQKHYSILLSTTVPDRKATLVRREDGFEKRLFLRCGRCRVVVGYFLDAVHFPSSSSTAATAATLDGEGGMEKVVYLLPGALVETEHMGDEGSDQEWRGWSAEL
ncbi:hypothetical protein BDV28DRAFT_156468 [Aspergillus coremiiformis]|uniref:STEEP1 domain-containing protein n=1 Tax=Aspergillus coremiiformis TaxID=138285 RepID=A0A5N6Z9K1_9EURO|nr:hypothetical protein BDV28DRAFT_156468 [Aspergillus coremiiformis]